MSHLEPSSKIVVAEISLVPLVKGKVSMSDEIAIAFLAIKKTKGLKVTLTGMGTQVESSNLKSILTAVEAAHEAVEKVGASRIITTIRIDQRMDKIHTLKDRVQNVKSKLYGH
ncbi:MAG: MTH1187 family thiamine-binding protein [Nitrososphaeraceae archaeon]|nr:MTH1187 family thiamine-binding protein [Nitrososphaeraceae archaeon]